MIGFSGFWTLRICKFEGKLLTSWGCNVLICKMRGLDVFPALIPSLFCKQLGEEKKWRL